jgi:hypothetical protein
MMSNQLPIPHFVGGVSTQPETQQVPGQTLEATNVFLPIERGATKRNGLLPVLTAETRKQLDLVASDEMHYHWIDRDGVRRYLVVICPDAVVPADDLIQVFDITDGTRKVVNYTANGYTEDPADYVAVTGGTIKCLTVGDTTLILNTAVTCDDAGLDTSYTFGGTSVDLAANAHYKEDYTEFDQPGTANDYWFAANDAVGRPAGYYKALGTTVGPKYERVHAREAGWRLKADTMPVKMTYNAGTDEFDVTCINWAERLSGDTETNPTPGFVGNTLESFAFHQDRFWLAWQDRCIASVVGDYWNFWLDNWRSVGDSDPVEVGTIGDRVTYIKHMVSFNSSMLLFCTGDVQFEVKSADGQLTPSSVAIIPSTQNSVDHDCLPYKMNDRVFFLSRVEPIKLYEYFYNYDAYSNVAVDVSLHVQGYLPADPVEIRTSDTHNLVACLFDSARNEIYAHYSVIAGAEKVQSAWCKWEFDADDEIRSMFIYDSWMYVVVLRGTDYYLDRMYLGVEDNDSGLDIACKMDRRLSVTGVYNSTTRRTTWTLPWSDPTMTMVILGSAFTTRAGFQRVVTSAESGGVTTLSCAGDYSTGACWIGRPFEARLDLARPYIKDQNGRVVPGAMNILNLRVTHSNTGYYEVQVTPFRRETKTHTFNPIRIGSAIIGDLTIDPSGEFFCKPMVSTEEMDISIVSSSHLPMTVVNGTYGIRFTRGKRNPAK